ncbi:TonB-dependent receptor plug [Paraburkholderia phymatum STM815]|uniref:TonB-dependent receptor plug n=1 Tax=Paraburkholderia phymatum (strain DSM 17167 / CIP 108236 / LMG 21445 / STM815) TaxID=391038 RepID=B2JES3_PARP8|nr:TonB-dependent receptor plug [Paraburkholderia phymatum STM815]
MLTPLFVQPALPRPHAPPAFIAPLAVMAFAWVPLAVHAQSDDTANPSAKSTDPSDNASNRLQAAASWSNDTATLSPIVVTAGRGAQRLAEAIAQTTLFDAQDIADTTARDLPGFLQFAPGAQIVRNGGPGSTSSLFLRGASATQSLVLIDGVRVDSVSQGNAQLEQIPLDQIDHVEVVNGNVSALYGSGAIGGVVQVFTKDGANHPPRFHFEVEYGSYHTQREAAGIDGALDKDGTTTFSVMFARAKTDGFSSIDPALVPVNPNANGYFDESVSASLRHKLNDRWDIGLRYFLSNGDDSFDNPFGLPADLNNVRSKVQTASAFANGKLSNGWAMRFIVATGIDRSNTSLNGAYRYRYDSDNRQYTWQNDFTFARNQKLQVGYEHLDQTLDSNQYSAPDRHVNSVFAGYTARLGDSQIQANLRRDEYSDLGGANSYYLGYGYDFDERWKATASWSDAFRAPSFNDLYYPYSGNPLIQPERSHSVEAALQYTSDALGLMKLTAFETRYTNLIDYVQTTPGIYVAENVGQAKVQGIEGSWAGRVGKTDVRAAVTLQNPVDEDTHTDLNRRARHFASFAANRNIGGWRVGGEWIVSGERDDSGTPLGGYGVVNLPRATTSRRPGT